MQAGAVSAGLFVRRDDLGGVGWRHVGVERADREDGAGAADELRALKSAIRRPGTAADVSAVASALIAQQPKNQAAETGVGSTRPGLTAPKKTPSMPPANRSSYG